MPEFEIVNVVATVDLQQQVDIIQVAHLPHTIHNREIYGGRVTYLKTPMMSGKVTIFPSGKLISVGTKSPVEAQKDLEKAVETLASVGLITPIYLEVKLRNIVALCCLGVTIDLESLSLSVDGIYEPEQFPGMIIRLDVPKVTFLVFSSGKVVIAGSIRVKDIKRAIEKLYEIVDILK